MELSGDDEEQAFNDAIRHYIISLLVFIWLYSISYVVVTRYKKRKDEDEETSNSLCPPPRYDDADDDFVYRISLWLCCFTITVSIGAVLLLPISILSNEILLSYPDSYYIKWLNDTLIHGLWNQIFLGTYFALFLAMPFAYFFTESEGFAGSRKGIKARVFETLVVLLLLGVLVSSLIWIFSGFFLSRFTHTLRGDDGAWFPYLPFMYSCISLFGVLLLLVCTPLGFASIFSILGTYVTKPQFLRDLDDEIQAIEFEEDTLKRRTGVNIQNGYHSSPANGRMSAAVQKLLELEEKKKKLQHDRDASVWERNLLYPLCLLMLLALTASCICMVALNCLNLLFVKGTLLFNTKASLGKMSFSMLGSFGAMLEIILIFYIMAASLVGLYSIPPFHNIKPQQSKTTMTRMIANCIILLVLSSALPVLARTLGITSFDLMGEFGRLDWLGNIHLVLFYNLVFEASASFCLVNKFTSSVRKALFEQVKLSPLFRNVMFRAKES